MGDIDQKVARSPPVIAHPITIDLGRAAMLSLIYITRSSALI
jgi:hypothetical protein